MAEEFQPQAVLDWLDGCGIKVDEDGYISNWKDRPGHSARPLVPNEEGARTVRRAFTLREDEILQEWGAAAEAEGIRGSRAFEQLEVLVPTHTWQAYQNRYRKTIRPNSHMVLSFDAPFPNLDRTMVPTHLVGQEYLGDVESNETPKHGTETTMAQRQIQEQQAGSLKDMNNETYSDSRIETDRVLYERLHVENESGLCHFLRQAWVLRLHEEFENSLVDRAPAAVDDRNALLPGGPVGPSRHSWKVARAAFVLSLPRVPSRYTAENPDKTHWSTDDHDIQFIVRAVTLGKRRGCAWFETAQTLHGTDVLCERALWLLLWFYWLSKTTTGTGREMQRLQQKRLHWQTLLRDERARHAEAQGLSSSKLSYSALAHRRRRNDEIRQQFLLSDEARCSWIRQRNQMLAAWGVGAGHSNTCVLVPQEWKWTQPEDIATQVGSWPTVETESSRLSISMGSFKLSWARAAAWFESWPRDTIELQHFLPPNAERFEESHMHGSHLCHHGLCIIPSHITYEDKDSNLSRRSCAYAAFILRTYGHPVPQHCVKHDPPCLLQFAALTSFEMFAIQFSVLALAKDLPASSPIERPSHHPSTFKTFECNPTPGVDFPTVGVRPGEVTRIHSSPGKFNEHFQWSCSLCPNLRTWRNMPSFWLHLRSQHQDEDHQRILQEVTRSARAYCGWIDERGYNYERQNGNTWQKLVQAQASDFEWHVFEGWRLSRSRPQRLTSSGTNADDVAGPATQLLAVDSINT